MTNLSRPSPRKRPGTAPEPLRYPSMDEDAHPSPKTELGPGLEIPWRYLSLVPPGAGEAKDSRWTKVSEASEQKVGKNGDGFKTQLNTAEDEEMTRAGDLASLFPKVDVPSRSEFCNQDLEEVNANSSYIFRKYDQETRRREAYRRPNSKATRQPEAQNKRGSAKI